MAVSSSSAHQVMSLPLKGFKNQDKADILLLCPVFTPTAYYPVFVRYFTGIFFNRGIITTSRQAIPSVPIPTRRQTMPALLIVLLRLAKCSFGHLLPSSGTQVTLRHTKKVRKLSGPHTPRSLERARASARRLGVIIHIDEGLVESVRRLHPSAVAL